MANHSQTKALLERLNKELDGKLECSAEVKRELEELIAELEQAEKLEVSNAKRQALLKKSLTLLGLIVRLAIPEIHDFLGD